MSQGRGQGVQGKWRHFPGYMSDPDCISLALRLNDEESAGKEPRPPKERPPPPAPRETREADLSHLSPVQIKEFRVLEFLKAQMKSRDKEGVLEEKVRTPLGPGWAAQLARLALLDSRIPRSAPFAAS